MDTLNFLSDHHGVEKSFRASKSLVTDFNLISVRKLIYLIFLAGRFIFFHFSLEVLGNITDFFFNISGDFSFGRGSKLASNFSG